MSTERIVEPIQIIGFIYTVDTSNDIVITNKVEAARMGIIGQKQRVIANQDAIDLVQVGLHNVFWCYSLSSNSCSFEVEI